MAGERVAAVVVRGSYDWVSPDGKERKNIYPGAGKDSEVMVPAHHLEVFAGVIVAAKDAKAELQKAASEALQTPTPSREATKPPTTDEEPPENSNNNRRR
jgi:hypothetical protein